MGIMSEKSPGHKLKYASYLLLATAIPLCYLALGALFGIGMVRKVPVWVNISLSSLVLFVPPLALSISSAFRSQLLGLGYSVWALLILYCFPMYFPNERVLAMRNGLSMLGLESELAMQIERTLPRAKNGREPLLMASMSKMETIELTELEEGITSVPFEGRGTSMSVPLGVGQGTLNEAELWMLFDTGASYTTLNTPTLLELGVVVPRSAPEITMQTAAGERKTRLVVLEDVWFGGIEVGTITVAVCEECADTERSGLLGLNVSRRFLVTVNQESKELLLEPLPNWNQTPDIRPWLYISGKATQWPGGNVEVEVSVLNRASVTVTDSIIEVRCRESYSTAIAQIRPGQSKVETVRLPEGAHCDVYAIGLKSASW